MSLCHYTYTLEGSWGGWWWGGWRIHWVDGWVMGWVVEGFMGWVVVWVLGRTSWIGWMCDGVGNGGVGGCRVHWVGAYTHPPMNSYNVKRFNFMNSHPPIEHIQSVTLSLYIYFGWFMG